MAGESKNRKPRAGVILIRDSKILLMYRQKNGRRYYAIPGGKVDAGESVEDAAIREMFEETSLRVRLLKKLWAFQQNGRMEHFFLAAPCPGKARMQGPELAKAGPLNEYRLEWHAIGNLSQIPLDPPKGKRKLLEYFSLPASAPAARKPLQKKAPKRTSRKKAQKRQGSR